MKYNASYEIWTLCEIIVLVAQFFIHLATELYE